MMSWINVLTAGHTALSIAAFPQAFSKIPLLHAMAPTLKEPPFGIAQGIVLVMFAALAFSAIRQSTAAGYAAFGPARR